ncbi:MAG: hypothetical protein H7833_05180 [Magnetococcus sp. DMHC-1]|nr:hypothetical protein [Magnetococcales bacterium]
MPKKTSKIAQEIFDQVAKARQALDYFAEQALDDRGEFRDGTQVRARLNAARAHVTRAIEKANALK